MLNLLIVDDEPMFREGLVKTINWEKLGYSEVREAYNGVEALNIIKSVPIDLIITDIRMPEMDGLELIQKVTEEYPGTRFIVLSAFDEFCLVKEAFQLGIVDYILKSEVTESELTVILGRQAQEVNRRKKFPEQHKGDYAERNNRIVLQQLLRNSIERGVSFRNIPELKAYFGYVEDNPVYSVVVCLHYTDYSVKPDTITEYLAQGGAFVESLIIAKTEWLFFSESNHIYLFYVPPQEIGWKDFYNKTEELRFDIQQKLQEKSLFWKVTAGFSSVRKSSVLSRSKTEAERACHFSFFRGIGRSISYSHYQKSLDLPDPDCQKLFREFVQTLKNRNISNLHDAVCHYQLSPLKCSGSSLERIRDLYRKYYYHLLSFCERLGIDGSLKDGFEIFATLEVSNAPLVDLNNWLGEMINLVFASITSHHTLVGEVVAYLQNNYNRELTLTEIADIFHVNSSYLSRKFSKEIGKGFSAYLMEMRINKALELMSERDIKIYEVAERVGILNPESFSRNFKKITGCSPREYFS